MRVCGCLLFGWGVWDLETERAVVAVVIFISDCEALMRRRWRVERTRQLQIGVRMSVFQVVSIDLISSLSLSSF